MLFSVWLAQKTVPCGGRRKLEAMLSLVQEELEALVHSYVIPGHFGTCLHTYHFNDQNADGSLQ